MIMQKWKTDKSLNSCPTVKDGNQTKKLLDYSTTYRVEFLESDPLRDWESFERCKFLWDWVIKQIDVNEIERVLDCGTKDCQQPMWLQEQGFDAIGLEYSENYVKYALSKNRPIVHGNVCEMEFEDNSFDIVTAHHLLGLVPDNLKALQEMYRVSSGYVLNLSECPGNPKKHFSYMPDNKLFNQFINSVDCEVIYNDYLDTGIKNEYVIFIRKN
jgi:ubiquinone/menaquinone biosynthesis C-methylase UbiE